MEDNMDELIEKTKCVKKVIFHCALSQVRGPKSARMYAEARQEKLKDEAPDQEVLVLRGGFTEFQAAYRDDPKLVEKWEKEVWGPDGSGWY
ncbi:hypothetical protein FRC03_012912 [Tulasnella sp. 419]|nr:hypothetical protein FRC03_012912 [Tulasnella sp. 419]